MSENRDEKEQKPRSHWKFGVYYNRDDPRYLVPDFQGLGMTLNFAKFINLKGLGILVVLIAVVILAKVFLQMIR